MMPFFPARSAASRTGFAVFREARGKLAAGHEDQK
jgi:hypothetical protein